MASRANKLVAVLMAVVGISIFGSASTPRPHPDGFNGLMFGLGNVEEQYRAMVLGVKGRGRQSDGPLNHWTGKGWVKSKDGQYTPALRRRKFVLPVIVERGFSGKDNHTKAHIRKLGDTAAGAGATDRTAYGRHRGSTRSFVTHHTQQISKACIVGSTAAIVKKVTQLKRKACKVPAGGAAHGWGA